MFETYCVKWEDHNISINNDKIILGPIIRVVHKDNFKPAITLHKWNLDPSGKALGVYIFDTSISCDDSFWRNPKQSSFYDQICNELIKLEKKLKSYCTEQLVNEIENDCLESCVIYKYHANQWRPVTKNKAKWVYAEKAIKTDICNVQIVLA